MNYYTIQENFIVHYQVKLHYEELKKLRQDIIFHCSNITHECYEDFETPNLYQMEEHIHNYHEKKVGIALDYDGNMKSSYYIEYDYYHHPLLVKWIDEIMEGKTSSILNIQKMDKEKELDLEQQFKEEYQSIAQRFLNEGLNCVYPVFEDFQKRFDHYQKNKALNKNQVSAYCYKERVLDCIQLQEVSRMSKGIVMDMIEFLKPLSITSADPAIIEDIGKNPKLFFLKK